MIGRHVDIIAIAVLLAGIAIYSHVRQSILFKILNERRASDNRARRGDGTGTSANANRLQVAGFDDLVAQC